MIDPCAPDQMTCPDTGKCSVLNMVCDPQLVEEFSEPGAPPAPEPFIPKPDTTPPVLRHIGPCLPPGCYQAATPSGTVVRVHRLEVGEEFQDAGDYGTLGCSRMWAHSQELCSCSPAVIELLLTRFVSRNVQGPRPPMTKMETLPKKCLWSTSRRA